MNKKKIWYGKAKSIQKECQKMHEIFAASPCTFCEYVAECEELCRNNVIPCDWNIPQPESKPRPRERRNPNERTRL